MESKLCKRLRKDGHSVSSRASKLKTNGTKSNQSLLKKLNVDCILVVLKFLDCKSISSVECVSKIFSGPPLEKCPRRPCILELAVRLAAADVGLSWPRRNVGESWASLLWRVNLRIGSDVDAQDLSPHELYIPKWFDAVIVSERKPISNESSARTSNSQRNAAEWNPGEWRVHFRGWSSRFDEWLPKVSRRIQPLWKMVPPWRKFKIGQKVDAKYLHGSGSDEAWRLSYTTKNYFF